MMHDHGKSDSSVVPRKSPNKAAEPAAEAMEGSGLAHHALRTVRATLVTKKVRHLYEADIRGYFTHINHQWLRRMVAHRIADGVILRR